MKKIILLALVAILGLSPQLSAQYATVNYDYELNRFGENEPLPAEKSLLFTGAIPPDIDIVEIAVFSAKGKDSRDPLARSEWKRPYDRTGNSFSLPLNYKLQASKEYDLEVQFFRSIGSNEKKALYDQMLATLDIYIDQALSAKKHGVRLSHSSRRTIRDMNDIVDRALHNYRSRTYMDFPGFSELVKLKLKSLDDARLSKTHREQTDAAAREQEEEQQRIYREKIIGELKQLVYSEVDFVNQQEFTMLVDRRYVDDYETEKRDTYFALNAGYGGVWLDDKLDQSSSFGGSPYFGVGFPLSTSTIAPKFFRNASITLGFFSKNFENDIGQKITGPIVNRPLYAGLDYKLFSFVRFNAGAAFLEEPSGADGSGSSIFVRPFVGLSAKVNISLGLDK